MLGQKKKTIKMKILKWVLCVFRNHFHVPMGVVCLNIDVAKPFSVYPKFSLILFVYFYHWLFLFSFSSDMRYDYSFETCPQYLWAKRMYIQFMLLKEQYQCTYRIPSTVEWVEARYIYTHTQTAHTENKYIYIIIQQRR